MLFVIGCKILPVYHDLRYSSTTIIFPFSKILWCTCLHVRLHIFNHGALANL
uniref:Uncharacterized protein n=1 Tax=Rhizophora mucronata TaxID=61149 RepID=A0A2P2KSR5_RHIMU